MLKAGITRTQETSFNLYQGLLHVPVDITIGKMHPSFTMFLEKRKSSHFKIIGTLLFYFGRYQKKPCSKVFTLYQNKVLHSHWNNSHFEGQREIKLIVVVVDIWDQFGNVCHICYFQCLLTSLDTLEVATLKGPYFSRITTFRNCYQWTTTF